MTPSLPAPRLTIVVATRNRRDTLLGTLARLTALEAAYPVVVVDNASADGTAAAVTEAFPAVTVIALERNNGPAARTRGVEHATTPYVAFADDDSWWAPGGLARAVALFERHPRLGLLAARVLVGAEERLDATSARMARSPLLHPPGAPGIPVLGFLACAAVVRRSAFLAAGGFHPRFAIGGEEGLLATDLARAGWWVSYAPELACHHHPSPSRDPAGRRRIETRNRLWEIWLRRPLPGALAATWAAVRRDWRDPARRRGALAALRGLPWVVRERSPVPEWLERQLRLLERD
jgi:GT2 family glycosyltransferase